MADDFQDLPYQPWSEGDWKKLVLAIEQKRCTPFLGAGAASPPLPLGRDLAERLARELDYPFEDRTNLVRVAQWGAFREGSPHIKGLVKRELERCPRPDFRPEHARRDDPHALVAELELPVYLTTNYDDFLVSAIRARRAGQELDRRLCRWHRGDASDAELEPALPPPTPARPLVFHLHGHLDELDSMVLTEDDYLDFLVRLTENEARAEDPREMLIPPRVREAFRNSTLLFLGYSLEDTNFRVLFRTFANYLHKAEGPRHVAVQIKKDRAQLDDSARRTLDAHIHYLQESFKAQKVRLFWGSCAEFTAALRERWEKRNELARP